MFTYFIYVNCINYVIYLNFSNHCNLFPVFSPSRLASFSRAATIARSARTVSSWPISTFLHSAGAGRQEARKGLRLPDHRCCRGGNGGSYDHDGHVDHGGHCGREWLFEWPHGFSRGGGPEQPLSAWPADPRGQTTGHKANRNPSLPGCLSADRDDASDPQIGPQLARPVLLLYSPFSFGRSASGRLRGIARGRAVDSIGPTLDTRFRVGSAWCECGCQVTGIFRGASMPVVPIGCRFGRPPRHRVCLSFLPRGPLPDLSSHMLSLRDRFAAAFGGPLGDHWQSAPSSAVVLPRPNLVAGAGVLKLFWSVNDGWKSSL